MTTCPYCGQSAMSFLKKITVGPARKVSCDYCGEKVSMPWWSMIGVAPLLLLGVWEPLVVFIVGFLVMCALWAVIPLQGR